MSVDIWALTPRQSRKPWDSGRKDREGSVKTKPTKLFGTFSGVFVPSFEAILGAVLFLVLPMLAGAMGLSRMLLIVVLSNSITLATAFSIADTATNLERVGAGGMFAIARRSLGSAFGGSIGIQLYFAQAACIGFYAIGFAEPLTSALMRLGPMEALLGGLSPLAQKQIVATVVATAAFVTAIVGANFIAKIQIGILVLLVASVISILVTPLLRPSTASGAPVFSGFNLTGGIGAMGFWAAFTAFFPAVTGIDAGVGMSGNLVEPKRSLPRGTFAAIGVTFVVYVLVTLVYSRVDPGLLAPAGDGSMTTASSLFSAIPVVPQLVLVGILVATASSALSYFMTAPRTAQALVQQNILPRFLSFLGRDFSRRGTEPRWATVVTYLIVLPVIWSGDITAASMVVGICFLVVYGWVNFAAFLERVSGNPSFRPTSRGHWAISLFGFLGSLVVIARFNVWVGLGVVVSQITVFLLLLRFKSQRKMEGVWWGVLFTWLNVVFRYMRRIIQGTKNWRPVVGVFCMADNDEVSRATLRIGRRIGMHQGLIMVNVLRPEHIETPSFATPEDGREICVEGDDLSTAISSVAQSAVPGGLQINTAVFPVDERLNHERIIEDLVAADKNVILYKHGTLLSETSGFIDVWWKGEANGNFMALLSYIISRNDRTEQGVVRSVRIMRRLLDGEEEIRGRAEMEKLLVSARLPGEVVIVPDDEKPLRDTVRQYSREATLILMGVPGERAGGLARLFSLDKLFFSHEVGRWEDMPPMLFVKAARPMALLE